MVSTGYNEHFKDEKPNYTSKTKQKNGQKIQTGISPKMEHIAL